MKKTLLTIAAALAASVISSQAQVYSLNIVGYANVVTASSALTYSLSVPFQTGVSNGANEVLPNIPEFSSVLIWNPVLNGFASYAKDSSSAPTTGWTLEGNECPIPVLAPGSAFFYTPGSDNTTNTFAGTIVVAVGTKNTNTFASSALTYHTGSKVPYAGSVTNGTSSGGGLNMNSLPEFTSVLIWDPVLNGFASYAKDASSAPSTGWTLEGNEATPPSLTVGQGFFLTPGTDGGQWTVGL